MDIKDIKKNAAEITGGQWVGDIPDMGDLRLRVRGLSSPQVIAIRSRKERAVPRKERLRDGSLRPETGLRISGEVLHEAVLLDWSGLTSDGKPVKYDAALAAEWCTNPDYQDFASAVAWSAMVVDRGDADRTEELAGN